MADVVAGTNFKYVRATGLHSDTNVAYTSDPNTILSNIGVPYSISNPVHSDTLLTLDFRITKADAVTTVSYTRANPADNVTLLPFVTKIATVDTGFTLVHCLGDTVDASTRAMWNETTAMDNNTKVTYGVADSVDSSTSGSWNSTTAINTSRVITWGYGLNNFLIGGVTTLRSDVEIEPPPEPINHIKYEVFRIVNNVSITVRPDNAPVLFANLTITRDIESFAWTVNFDVYDTSSYNAVRPQGRTVKTVDININGTVFTMFIGSTSASRRAGANGVVTNTYRCTGWSNLKMLSYPYANRRSRTSTAALTAAQTVTAELGSQYPVTWETQDWQLAAGVHSYQSQTPLGAALQVINAVGAVIVPDTTTQAVTVRPYFPVSPWQWDDTGTFINRTMFESQFFSISNDTVPRDNPDGVFVYGQDETTGVGVQVLRQGRAGTALLPDVINQYMTANNAAQERGRIEIARNSFIESIPMETYIDENGIIMPQELIEFTELDGVTKWRGMVTGITITCQQQGTALTQRLTVARFFDG